jgi:hypothetical protein
MEHDTCASSAERFAHGELALTAIGPDENQIGDVRARHEEDETGRDGDHP